MILLLDLDDTLLTNPLDSFMPAYIRLLAGHLAKFIDPAKMVPQLLRATDLMITKDIPCGTLENTFDENFYPILGLKKEDLLPAIDHFYANSYQELKKFTEVRPGARQIIEFAFHHGWTVAIATNPLFPQKAMLSRLEWAEVPRSEFSYALVSAYETMHFAKPNPSYYSEILGQLGWPEEPVCMVGNSLSDDLLPAARLGIPGYWVSGTVEQLPAEMPASSSAGSIDELIPWLEKIADSNPLPQFNDPQGIIAVLKSTSAALDHFVSLIDPGSWRTRPSNNEWSFLEILYHMRDVEKEVNLPRFMKLNQEDNPFIPGIDSDRWAIERDYIHQESRNILESFCQSRVDLINILSGYKPDDWKQSVRHSIFGPTTRLELASFIAMHDRTHLQQVDCTIKAINK